MRRRWWAIAVAAVVGLLGAAQCRADFDLLEVGGQPLTITGTERARWEVWNWFTPGIVANGQENNRYYFQDTFVRLGAGYQLDGVKAFAELMSPGLFNLPADAAASALTITISSATRAIPASAAATWRRCSTRA